jgi:hypothetical protein
VKLAKADLVPKDTNLRPVYGSFSELEVACEVFCDQVNTRVHRVTRRAPADMLAQERARLHPLPATPHTVSFGVTRTVAATTPMVTFDSAQYSVPHPLLGQLVWVRIHGRGEDEAIVIVHVGDDGPVEVARHHRASPGSPAMQDGHFPPAPAGALARAPKPRTAAEAEFLELGAGARLWLIEAAAVGTTKMRVKMAEAVTTAKLVGITEVDWALGHAAVHARFAEADLASILDHHARTQPGPVHQAGEQQSLTQGTAGWAALGRDQATSQPEGQLEGGVAS